ncbi:MAG TPA: DUF3426 domain-containing protein, partial [Burkholderiaceae bacterium]|nr:DUF3426 domain-containing protein [Burkholderiaceae bacterium]
TGSATPAAGDATAPDARPADGAAAPGEADGAPPRSLPADPWAAAAAAVHERSLRDDADADPPEGPDRDAPPSPPARRDDGWPTIEGPRTIIGSAEDLKTAFFLPDTGTGPAPFEPPAPKPVPIYRSDAAGNVPAARAASDDAFALRPEAPRDDAPDDEDERAGPPTRWQPQPDDRAGPPTRWQSPPDDRAGPPTRWQPQPGTLAFDATPAPVSPWADAPGPRGTWEPLAPPVAAPPAASGLARVPLAWAAVGVLALALVLQALVGWRDAIAARAPVLAPVLAVLAAPFGLGIGPPRELDALTIEGFELRPGAKPDQLLLTAVLRNRVDHRVGFPSMELTLTDSTGGLLVRKVIPAEAYLDGASGDAGLAPRSERPLRVALEHGGLQPTGYAVALFYP